MLKSSYSFASVFNIHLMQRSLEGPVKQRKKAVRQDKTKTGIKGLSG